MLHKLRAVCRFHDVVEELKYDRQTFHKEVSTELLFHVSLLHASCTWQQSH